MSTHQHLARPYAIAAYEYATEHQQVAKWGDMLALLADIVLYPQVALLVVDPKQTAQSLGDICIALTKEQLTTEGENFVRLLAEADKLSVLPAIKTEFESFRAEVDKKVIVSVTSVVPLTDAIKQQLIAALKERFGREPVLEFAQDPALIGGMLVKVGDTVIDGSVMGQLTRVTQELVR